MDMATDTRRTKVNRRRALLFIDDPFFSVRYGEGDERTTKFREEGFIKHLTWSFRGAILILRQIPYGGP